MAPGFESQPDGVRIIPVDQKQGNGKQEYREHGKCQKTFRKQVFVHFHIQ